MFDVGDSQAASRHWASIPQCPELYAGTWLVLKLLIHIQSSRRYALYLLVELASVSLLDGFYSLFNSVEDYPMKLEMDHDNISDRLIYHLVPLSSQRLQRESIVAC